MHSRDLGCRGILFAAERRRTPKPNSSSNGSKCSRIASSQSAAMAEWGWWRARRLRGRSLEWFGACQHQRGGRGPSGAAPGQFGGRVGATGSCLEVAAGAARLSAVETYALGCSRRRDAGGAAAAAGRHPYKAAGVLCVGHWCLVSGLRVASVEMLRGYALMGLGGEGEKG